MSAFAPDVLEIADDAPETLDALLAAHRWGDGLPVIAPTEARVDAMLNDAKENQLTIPVRLIDDIEISRSLPNASLEIEKALA